ncbi:MAG: metalloregulator ArsR/SmtB family transcription factor [Acidobacteria bacterium]|nr:metalloregulator ArsR/SmtB family transcription factor [Acidobacteriota bacterium]
MLHSASAQSAKIAATFHALGDPTRRVIVEKLCEQPQSASLLAAPLGITVAAVVQHLAILEQSGLIRSEKIGRIRTCRLEPSGLKTLEDWVSQRRTLWERRLDKLGEVLDEE